MKKKIDGFVIVEGKMDTAKLQRLFDVKTIETNGLNLSNKKLEYIKKLSENNRIILFLDPDGPGSKIRRKIEGVLSKFDEVYITKDDIPRESKKIGVAEAFDESILNAFERFVSFEKNEIFSVSFEQYQKLNLNTVDKRKEFCKKINVELCNNKQLFKKINYLNLKYEDLIKII